MAAGRSARDRTRRERGVTPEARIQIMLANFLVRRRDLNRDEEARRFAEEHVAGSALVSPVERLETYREQYWLRHTSSLVEDFPGVSGVLGQTDWERLVEEYLVAHPPRSFSLRDLGSSLPDFTATRDWLPHRELVADMARLEWAHVEVFDAPDARPLDPQKLVGIPEDAWQDVRLVPNPALRLLESSHPVVELWRQLCVARTDATRAQEPLAIPAKKRENLVVQRRKLEIEHDRLEPEAFMLLSKLCASIPLGVACESVASEYVLSPESIGARIEAWFATFTARGYLIDVLTGGRESAPDPSAV